jgi:TIR domain
MSPRDVAEGSKPPVPRCSRLVRSRSKTRQGACHRLQNARWQADTVAFVQDAEAVCVSAFYLARRVPINRQQMSLLEQAGCDRAGAKTRLTQLGHPRVYFCCDAQRSILQSSVVKCIRVRVIAHSSRTGVSLQKSHSSRAHGHMKAFVNYRRGDSPSITARIFDRLTSHFGRESIHIDVDSMALGADFRATAQRAIEACDYFLVIIGPQWFGNDGAQDSRNVSAAVADEIETALRANKLIVPILADGATMPSRSALPPAACELALLNPLTVRAGVDFDRDMRRIIEFMEAAEGMRGHVRRMEAQPNALSSAGGSPKIVLSYRRADTSGVAGRLFDRIRERFGAPNVFMDIDSIPFGTNFRTHIRNTLTECKIVVALMGKDWVGKRLFPFQARIFNANDPIRLEMHTALTMNVPILPVLVDGAKVESMRLPKELGELRELNAAPLSSGQDFDHHADRLLKAIENILEHSATGTASSPIH